MKGVTQLMRSSSPFKREQSFRNFSFAEAGFDQERWVQKRRNFVTHVKLHLPPGWREEPQSTAEQQKTETSFLWLVTKRVVNALIW